MKNQWRVIAWVALVLIIVIFAVLNNQVVPVNFGFLEISGPLILVILSSSIIGVLVGLLASTTTMWQQRKKVKELEKSVELYKTEAKKLATEEAEKVQRNYENQLADLQAKYDALTSTARSFEDISSEENNRVERFTKPREAEK